MGMTKPQPCPTPPRYDEDYFEMMDVLDGRKEKMSNPCPHDKNADPAQVPTGTIAHGSPKPDGWHTSSVQCGICWQRHSEWLNSALADRDEYIQEIGDEIATAKADTARLDWMQKMTLNKYLALFMGGMNDSYKCPRLRQAIDKAKEKP